MNLLTLVAALFVFAPASTFAESVVTKINSHRGPIAKRVSVDVTGDLVDRDTGFKKEFVIVLGDVHFKRSTPIVFRDAILETEILQDLSSTGLDVSVKEEDVVPNHMTRIDHSEVFFEKAPLRHGQTRARRVGRDEVIVRVYEAERISGSEFLNIIRSVVNGCTLTRGDGVAYRNYRYTDSTLCTMLEESLKILRNRGFKKEELGQLVREIGPRGIKASLLNALLDSVYRSP